jgi:hypothetical protein
LVGRMASDKCCSWPNVGIEWVATRADAQQRER